MKTLIRNSLVAVVAVVGSMPIHAAGAASGPCDGHGGIRSASATPTGNGFDLTVQCVDGLRRGPLRYQASGAYPCADNGGVHSATARPGAGVIEITVYCNDGASEGPFVYQIR